MGDMSQARCKIQYLMVSVLLILVEDLLESCGYRLVSRLRSGRTIEERRKDARKSWRRNNVVVGASFARKGSLSRRNDYHLETDVCPRSKVKQKRITRSGVTHELRIEGNGTSMRSVRISLIRS